MAGYMYWPRSFFACLWTSTPSRSINTQNIKLADIQPSRPHIWSITHIYNNSTSLNTARYQFYLFLLPPDRLAEIFLQPLHPLVPCDSILLVIKMIFLKKPTENTFRNKTGLLKLRIANLLKMKILTQLELDCCSVCEQDGAQVFILTAYFDSFSVKINGIDILSFPVFITTFFVVNICNC